MSRSRRLRARLLGVIRRGPRTVLWLPERMNLGNFLYHWMRAWQAQREGRDVRVLRTEAMAPWLPYFPAAADLVVAREAVRFTDRREMGMHQDWHVDYNERVLEPFLAEVVLTAPMFTEVATAPLAADDVVVNVRRGDYYADPAMHAVYAFDLHDYLRQALEITRERGPIGRIHVVSDGIAWCREHLGWLASYGRELTFAESDTGPVVDFLTLARARRLVLTNTTFGYWGGYLSNVIHGDNHGDVVAPWFHARIGDGKAEQLDPRWSVVAEIDGGWQKPPPFEPST